MTPEERIARLERVTKMMVNNGRKIRSEWREQSREQAEKINILIHMQMKLDENLAKRDERQKKIDEQLAKTDEQLAKTDAQIATLAVAQAELTKSQKLTDRALRAFINSLRKRHNGSS